ncbi:hypothetical protein [Brevibacillus reuszeri]|uniref:hypothetical protein n=1 Tax=Brevibacillus reuszeri TaxID=54915 RepID=UPI00128EB753|nr:hypothetical protein [Brevibacillus reuszeri]MED1859418.1 hypothetical protein [Brevibacillus reuszeri]
MGNKPDRLSRSRRRSRVGWGLVRDQIIGCFFVVGVASTLWGQPANTYSWMWQEVKDSGNPFRIGLLDISKSSLGSEWQVVQGGNQSIDLSRMIPGDARQLKATLSKGGSDLDFSYKIVARVKDSEKPGGAQKLEEVLHIRIEEGKDKIYEGLVRELHQETPGLVHVNGTENTFHTEEGGDKAFAITVYLPEEGIDHSFQSVSGELELRFLAKQATADAVYAE